MATEDIAFYNETPATKNKITEQKTKKQKQLEARKRIEDYIAEKQLRETINDFDYGF